jgi:hypothetical protein
MKLERRAIRYGLLSMLGFAIPLGLGVYNRDVDAGEGYHQFYKFPKASARPVILKYRDDGILHRLISPHTVGGTLGLTNTGRPVRIRLRMVGVPDGLTILWENGHTRGFNLETKTVDWALRPGDSISVHHTFYVGEKLRQRKVIFNGGLEILDDAAGTPLLRVPIRILNADDTQSAGTEEACHDL